MGIFSGLSTPAWVQGVDIFRPDPQTMQRGSQLGQGFAEAQQKSEQNKSGQDIASALQGLTPEEQRAKITSNPGWMANPRTAPIISNILRGQQQQLTMARDVAVTDSMTQQKAGEAMLATTIADIARNGSWTDPTARAKAWQVATKYPALMDTPAWKQTTDQFDKSDKAQLAYDKLQTESDALKSKNDITEERLKLASEKADQGSPAKRLLDEADQEEDLAKQARDSGNEAEFDRRTARANSLRESVNTHGEETVQTGFDDQGRPIVSVIKGGKGSSTQGTVGTQSLAQQNIIRYGNSIDLINSLQKSLRPMDVGVAGIGGEMLGDKGLAQAFPQFANQKRISNRAVMTVVRDSLMKTMSDDSRRFTTQDRMDVANSLPSNGAFESYADAMQKMTTAKNILIDRSRNYADRTGTPIPDYAKTKDEIVSGFQRKKNALIKAVQAGNLDQQEADAEIKKENDAALSLLQKNF